MSEPEPATNSTTPAPRRRSAAARLATLLPLILALLIYVPALDWGLPSRAVDRDLFGDRAPWTGDEILALLEPSQLESRDSNLGADVDADPIAYRSRPVVLNDTDAKRAEIVQRYRLMSGQPDEFIQFKALAEMAGRSGIDRFDPRLYQYGGLWIYPVGGLLKVCDMLGLVELRADRAFYLDHPEAFGRFYVVARAYSTFWALVAIAAVQWLIRRVTADVWLATIGAILFAITPVVWTAALEAKPHLAGTALSLLAVVAATKYLQTRELRYALLAGLFVGAAMGMVVSMLLSVGVIVGMGLLTCSMTVPVMRHERDAHATKFVVRRARPAVLALVVAGLTYALTNPFPIYNALFRPELLQSNLGNSAAMYGVSLAGLWRGVQIFADGVTPVVMLGAIVGVVLMLRRHVRWKRNPLACACAGDGTPLWLLAALGLPVGAMFLLLADGKPTEFARFSLPLAAAAVVAVMGGVEAAVRRNRSNGDRVAVAIVLTSLLIAWAALGGVRQIQERIRSLETLRRHAGLGWGTPLTLGTSYEPAPWSTPPVDLFQHTIVLVSPESDRTLWPEYVMYPANLASQVGESRRLERLSWKSSYTRVLHVPEARATP